MTGRADYLELGSWNAVCWECGRKRKSSQMVKNHEGYWVCPEHNDPQHPQEFVRAAPAEQPPPWTQSMPADVFVSLCSFNGQSAVPGWAIPGCSIPGNEFIDLEAPV